MGGSPDVCTGLTTFASPCLRSEYAHVLYKKGVMPGLIAHQDYPGAVRLLDDLGIKVHTTDVDALESAADLALAHQLRFFDAVVADRALQTGLPLLTADKALRYALNGMIEIELLRGI